MPVFSTRNNSPPGPGTPASGTSSTETSCAPFNTTARMATYQPFDERSGGGFCMPGILKLSHDTDFTGSTTTQRHDLPRADASLRILASGSVGGDSPWPPAYLVP